MHEVVVIAVKNAVSAATMTFTATSMMRFFTFSNLQFCALASHWGQIPDTSERPRRK